MSMTSSKSGSFRTAVRDALRSGLSCDRALAAGLGSTMDDTAHTEGARAIISTVLSGVRAGIASESGQSVSASTAKPQATTKTGPKPPVTTAAKPQTGGLKLGVAPRLKGGVKRPGTAKAPTSPASPTPVAVAKTPSTVVKPVVTPKPVPVPKVKPIKPTTPQSATGPKTQPIKPRKAPMAIKATVRKPPGIRPPAKYTPDAKRAFKQAFRDAVRENQPLSKLIELGVISGTQHNNMTPESAGTEYKSPVTKDAFRKRFADALAKGVSTTDALNAALVGDAPQGYYGVVRNKAGKSTHTTGPHLSHEVAKAEAFKVAPPKARTVETSRGEHGMDIRYHSR